jgi:EAL domain-containing protein (putative c-di-GMP-specific phosphodiesterase class I)
MSKNRVLVIDDDARIGRIVQRVANKLRVDTSVIDNPDLFESTYLRYQPNIIFLDLQMPRLDGVELLRKLAENDCKAAIILMSGMDKSVMETAIKFGQSLSLQMVGTLSKPMNIVDLERVLIKNFHQEEISIESVATITGVDLLEAIDRNELVVHYQPQICLKTGKISGAEALVRWQHPKYGLLAPDSFIPIAEDDLDLIRPLTFFVLKKAVELFKVLEKNGTNINLSVNISAKLLSDLDLPDQVEQLLRQYQFNPHRLILEITESGAMEDPSLTMDILTRLRLKNIRLSLDDFGTGFSSLVQLYRMPFNELKVDKSFVMGAISSKEAAAISRVTIDLGHSLGLEVVAEGVEDEETYNWLGSLGLRDLPRVFYQSSSGSGGFFNLDT